MKRKTNLFYTSGEDSKFLTFSNYTECLTGAFLSTNTKLFPSKFICLNIPNLNKEEFINGLVAYYENKLATLRDVINETENLKIEDLQPLSYLLTYLRNNGITNIAYVGDITEQDYNGTFTDTICVINTAKMFSGIILPTNSSTSTDILSDFVSGDENLYGWYKTINGVVTYIGPNNYANVSPIFDNADDHKYALSDISTIQILNDKSTSISFNVIIPLFSIVNTTGDLDETQLQLLDLNTDEINGTANINVPLGIWFADKTITLEGDNKYNTSWSLAIGSQFKPFPSSNLIESEITNESNSIAFGTFAQILSKQNDLLTYVQSENRRLQEQINNLQEEISQLKQLHQLQ